MLRNNRLVHYDTCASHFQTYCRCGPLSICHLPSDPRRPHTTLTPTPADLVHQTEHLSAFSSNSRLCTIDKQSVPQGVGGWVRQVRLVCMCVSVCVNEFDNNHHVTVVWQAVGLIRDVWIITNSQSHTRTTLLCLTIITSTTTLCFIN